MGVAGISPGSLLLIFFIALLVLGPKGWSRWAKSLVRLCVALGRA